MTIQTQEDQYHQILSEPTRIEAIHKLELTDSPAEEVFDRLTRLASRLVLSPVALMSIVDHEKQFFKSFVGLDEPWASSRQTLLSHSFCQHVVVSGEPLIIEDARNHSLVHDNLAITDLGVIGYLGMPLITQSGTTLGSFCVIDSEPRVWSDDDIETVRELAHSVMTEIELRNELNALKAAEANRKQLLKELQRSEDRYKTAVSAMVEGIILFNKEGKILTCNASAERILGLKFDQMKGQVSTNPEWPSIHKDGSPFPADKYPVILTLKTGVPQHNVIMGIQKSSGMVTWVSVNSQPLTHAGDEEPHGVIATFTDITAFRKAQQEAFDAAVEKERNDILSEFVQDALHEFRTPITIVNSSVYLIKKTSNEASRQQHADIIKAQVVTMSKLIDDMMLIWKLDHGYKINQSRLEIKRLVGQTIEEFRGSFNNIFEFNCEDIPTPFNGDSHLIRLAYRNVLQNAVDHSPAITPISTHVFLTEQNIVIQVEDKGNGMDAEELKQIFKRFYRGDEAHTRRGFGLGLSITKTIISYHQGTIEVSSVKGEGTVVTIKLPLQK